MAETVKRFRETAAWLVIGIGVVYVVLSLVRFVGLLVPAIGNSLVSTAFPDAGGRLPLSLAEAARVIGGSSLSVVMAIAIAAVCLACVLMTPVTPNARRIVRAGAGVLSAAIAVEVVMLVLSLTSPVGGVLGVLLEVLGALLEVGVKAVAATVLWRAARGSQEVVEPAVEPVAEATPAPSGPAASWEPDQAVGAVWTRAGDAASGAAASTVGTAGRASSGWEVASSAAERAEQPAVPRGAWATAAELAEGDALPAPSPDSQEPPAGVRWTPAPRAE